MTKGAEDKASHKHITQRGREREKRREEKREREREEKTLLHKDKDLSTSRLFFYKSVPDDKHRNTQNVKQEYKIMRQTKMQLKNKAKNYYCLKLCNIQTQQSNTDANLNFQERSEGLNQMSLQVTAQGFRTNK